MVFRFFDTTPIGRIINRFAGDTHIVDEVGIYTSHIVLICNLYIENMIKLLTFQSKPHNYDILFYSPMKLVIYIS